ncbi:hypothetical protein [Variovorax sp. WS11]|nr:hypothetical protein [Variovorax sp. WS11]
MALVGAAKINCGSSAPDIAIFLAGTTARKENILERTYCSALEIVELI